MSNRLETGQIQNEGIVVEKQNIPSVLRNTRGQIVWQLRGNTREQNEQIGINNIQGLFLQTYPDFNELFPRGKDGKIAEDKREEAKEFILSKIGTKRKLVACCGPTPVDVQTRYFGNTKTVIRKSFSRWDIQFENIYQGRKPQEIELIGEINLETVSFVAVSQREGLENLKDYLHGAVPFSALKPFLIKKVWIDPNGYPRVHVDKSERFSRKTIAIVLKKEIQEVFREGNGLLAIPKEDEHKLYQWIDFYKVESSNKVNLEEKVESVRVDTENAKFQGFGWNGHEVQLFLDYLAGKQSIESYKLKEFRIRVWSKKGYSMAYIGSANRRAIGVNISDPIIGQGQEVIVRPQYDQDHDTTWIEGYVKDEDGNEKHIFSRRFYKGDLKLYQFEEREKSISPDQANEELMKFLEAKD